MLFTILRSDRYIMPTTRAPCVAIKYSGADFSNKTNQKQFVQELIEKASKEHKTDSFRISRGLIVNQYLILGKHGSITVTFRSQHKYINIIAAPAYVNLLAKFSASS